MNSCYEYSINIQRYLDSELHGKRLNRLIAHLETCTHCRVVLEQEKALSDVLHQYRPLYIASDELRVRVSESSVQQSLSNIKKNSFLERFFNVFGDFFRGATRWLPRFKTLVPVSITIAAFLIFVPNVVREVRAASYVETAISTHRSYLTGDLPLAVQSNSPVVVSSWLAGKVHFSFRLPTYQSSDSNKSTYQLIGARLVSYKGSPVALVTYEAAPKDTISLLVASDNSAVIAGGDEVRSGDLVFHYRSESGFKIITWSTHGLSYALVSDVDGPAQKSCLVCHQNMEDHNVFSSTR